MLNENLKKLRKAKGLSQEELAVKINVVRQTVSKWEQGLSVPDSDMIIRLAEELDTTVNVLLGEDAEVEDISEIKLLSVKLELLNEQFARQNEKRRKILRGIFIAVGVIASVILFGELIEFIWACMILNSADGNIGIIGGADGPTQILIARTVNPLSEWIYALVALVVAAIGIYKTKRR